jgi:dTDP-4-dehydrorhamnose reductase
MKVLVTGADGLLAHGFRLRATPEFELIFLGRGDFDLAQPAQMAAQLDALRPQAVVNTAAYNLVEKCETERELSWTINATGPGELAQLCAARGLRLIHYGTDYVFNGAMRAPYVETDAPHPLNHYGAGKRAGECAVLAASPRHAVLRTSWVFGPHPTQAKSYVHTALRVLRAGKGMKATFDQVAAPTYAPDLAGWTLEFLRTDGAGLFHAVNDEPIDRFEWTRVIAAEARRAGLLAGDLLIEPVTTDYFPSPIKRPLYSVLDNAKLTRQLGHPLGSWRAGLRETLASLAPA